MVTVKKKLEVKEKQLADLNYLIGYLINGGCLGSRAVSEIKQMQEKQKKEDEILCQT